MFCSTFRALLSPQCKRKLTELTLVWKRHCFGELRMRERLLCPAGCEGAGRGAEVPAADAGRQSRQRDQHAGDRARHDRLRRCSHGRTRRAGAWTFSDAPPQKKKKKKKERNKQNVPSGTMFNIPKGHRTTLRDFPMCKFLVLILTKKNPTRVSFSSGPFCVCMSQSCCSADIFLHEDR